MLAFSRFPALDCAVLWPASLFSEEFRLRTIAYADIVRVHTATRIGWGISWGIGRAIART